MSNVIHQEVVIPASRARVYAALTKAEDFSAFSGGAPAEIDASPGGAFSLFGGRIVGRNLELEPDTRLVQAWRAGNWAPGEHSIVRFELRDEGSKTRIIFDQSGHPPSAHKHLGPGWSKMYWEPMAAHFK
jgi:activator of HSP90 ATPase